MVDKGFYEHREEDPIRRILAVVVLALGVLVVASAFGSTTTATLLGCPKWLEGTFRAGPVCLAPPTNGPIWLVRYRYFPSKHVRQNLASWSPAKRQRLCRALDASWICVLIGVVLACITATFAGIVTAKKLRAQRPKHKGTIFWANDEEVFNTGLAVNYRPPLFKRFQRWLNER